MKLTNELILTYLKELSIPQPDEFATLLMYKKREDLIRDLLFMRLLKETNSCEDHHVFPDWKPRSYVKHDCAILSSNYSPQAIIELKYAISSFVLDKQLEPISLNTEKQNNVWIEGFTSKSKKSGIVTDINRMLTTAKESEQLIGSKPSIHQILVIPLPKHMINKTRYLHIDYIHHNLHMNKHGHVNSYRSELKRVILNQFIVVNQTYFPSVEFSYDFCSLPIGNAFDEIELELLFFVFSAY